MSSPAPSAWRLQAVIAQAQATLDMLRTEHGQIIETDAELADAFADEGLGVDDVLRRLAQAALLARANAAAADGMIDDLTARRDRYRAHEDAYRTTLLQAMEALGLRYWSCVQATLSLAAGRPKVIISDDAADRLPDALVAIRIVRTPDKAAIRAALEAGDTVEGASLSNATPVLQVRSK